MISEKQKKILAFPYSKFDAIICDGAVRSGKTSIMMVAFVRWAMENFSGQRFGICGKTVDSTTKNIVMPFIAMSYTKKHYTIRWRRSDKLLEVRKGRAVNYFEVFGGKDESSFSLIQGRTLAGVLLDEVVLMPESFVNQALARCSVDGARLWFSCNPGNPSHWFKTEWIDKLDDHNALYLHFEMTDNPSLSEKTLSRYKSMYPSGVFYDRYIRGLWVAAEGLVYQDFASRTDEFLIDEPLKWCREHNQRITTVMIGVDFGGTGSANKFQATGITNKAVVIALDEEYINREIDPDALNKAYAAFVQRVSSIYGASQTRADSAEQILIRGLFHTAQKERLQTTVKNAMKLQIKDRIRLTLLLMAQKRLFVCRKCEHLIDAFQTAVYDPKRFDDTRLDDGTSDIDSLDAFEYSIEPWFKQLEEAGFRWNGNR